MIDIEITGLDATLDQFEAIAERLKEAARRGMTKWAEFTMGESKRECPVDTSLMKDSGTVTQLDDDVMLIYPVEYAIYVHEDLNAHHETGKAKFLEDPFMRELYQLAPDITDAINELLDEVV